MTPEQAYYHCLKHGRNADLEKIIATDINWAYLYARHAIKGRWIEGENIIATNPNCAFYYAKDVIKGRWIEAENVIIINYPSWWAYGYARHVIKGKLPENMHNMMLLHADKYAKKYLEFINKT